jgi:virulence factor Mce-like protein
VRVAALVAVVATVAVGLPACAGAVGALRITAYFPSAVGLYPQSDVRVLGLSAGRILTVAVQGDQVKVVMGIKDGIPVPADVRATIVPTSLIGERYVGLFPAWTQGQPRAGSGTVIPINRTSVPVEPDEALAAVKRLLDSLDPHATGRLVTNLSQDLAGQGQGLSDALNGLSQLTTTLASKDQDIVGIIGNIDRLSSTLSTREAELGKVLDEFAAATRVLADERQQIDTLVSGLAQVSAGGLDLVGRHQADLRADLDTLTRVFQSLVANIDSVRQLLDAAPIFVAGPDLTGTKTGLLTAYNPTYHEIDLRDAVGPLASQLVATLGTFLGLPLSTLCLPVGVTCPTAPAAGAAGAGSAAVPGSGATSGGTNPATGRRLSPGQGMPAAPTTTVPNLLTPIAPILGLLGIPPPTVKGSAVGTVTPAAPPARRHGDRRSGGWAGWLRRFTRSAVEALP